MGRALRNRSPISGEWMLVLFGLSLYLVVQIRTAWISDDAYITFRTISNLASGHGLVWNVGERVQAYTHPLWMFVVAAGVFLTHEFYYTSLGISILLSLAAMALLAGLVARTRMLALLGVAALVSSRAFVDYSTSGLENLLTYVLTVGYVAIHFRTVGRRSRLLALSLLAALIALNRLDILPLFLPSLLHEAWKARWAKALRSLLVGFLPLWVWGLFSLVYYGFPLPNTAYAKLATGVPGWELIQQGIYYLMNSLNADPVTLSLILAGVATAFIVRRPGSTPLGAGMLLYLMYVVRVGGDFMSGRFLVVPLLLAVACLIRLNVADRWAVTGLILVIAAGLAAPHPTLLSGADYGSQGEARIDAWGVSDERAFYYQGTGLLQARRHVDMPNHPWVHEGLAASGESGVKVSPVGAGFFGFYAGAGLHLVDLVGLGDPLLARLPASPDPFWRIGHFERRIPDGYLETLTSGRNSIAEPHLAEYYDKLSTIVSGPLFSRERWEAVLRMNLGAYRPLLKAYVDSLPLAVSIERFESIAENGENGRTITFSPDGLRISLGEAQHARGMLLRLERTTAYLAVFTLRSEEVTRKLIPASDPGGPDITDYVVGISAREARAGYDAFTLYPIAGQGNLRIAYAEILDG